MTFLINKKHKIVHYGVFSGSITLKSTTRTNEELKLKKHNHLSFITPGAIFYTHVKLN